LIVFKVTM